MARSKRKQAQRREIRRRDGDSCYICGNPFTKTNPATLDHLVELCQGGSNRLDNLALAHRTCNSFRSNEPKRIPRMIQTIINTTKKQNIDRWEDDGGFTPTNLKPPKSYLG